MPNPSYTAITTASTTTVYPDFMQSPFNLSYAVEFAAGTTGTYTVAYTLDDPNDTSWTPIWIADPTNPLAQTASAGGYFSFPIRGLQVIFSVIAGTASARLAVLQGMSSR